MIKHFQKLCTPAKIYFAIAVIGSFFALFKGMSVMSVAMKMVFAFIWTFALNWLCNKGFTSISWFLVALPYIIIALAMFGVYRLTHEQQQMIKSTQLQGAYGQEGMTPINTNKQKKVGK